MDLTRGRPPRLLDVLPGRSGPVFAGAIAERDAQWRKLVELAALYPFHGYAWASRTELPRAVRVLDAFPCLRSSRRGPGTSWPRHVGAPPVAGPGE